MTDAYVISTRHRNKRWLVRGNKIQEIQRAFGYEVEIKRHGKGNNGKIKVTIGGEEFNVKADNSEGNMFLPEIKVVHLGRER